jgi:hypothetical protein
LKAAGCERIFSEKVSGKSTNGRREFDKLMKGSVARRYRRGDQNSAAIFQLFRQIIAKPFFVHFCTFRAETKSCLLRRVYAMEDGRCGRRK